VLSRQCVRSGATGARVLARGSARAYLRRTERVLSQRLRAGQAGPRVAVVTRVSFSFVRRARFFLREGWSLPSGIRTGLQKFGGLRNLGALIDRSLRLWPSTGLFEAILPKVL
jgi:hypothetical protein